MSINSSQSKPMATAAAPSLIQQVGMAGTAAVITVSFIHPIDVVKVSPHQNSISHASYGGEGKGGL